MSTLSMTFPRIQVSQLDGRAHSFRHKESQFHGLYNGLLKSADTIKLAIQGDYLLTSTEVDFEFAQVLSELRTHFESLDCQKDLKLARLIETGVDNVERTIPVGIVYIVPSKWSLVSSVISVVGAAIVAGSCAIVELPQTLTQTSAAFRKVLVESLDPDTFAVCNVRPPSEFTRKCMLVLQTEEEVKPTEWSQVLPSPVSSGVVAVVDRTANITEAAEAVAEANFALGGKSAYAPQLVLVDEFVAETFLSRLVSRVGRSGGETKAIGHAGQFRGDRDAPGDITKAANTTVLASGANGTIVVALDRKAPLLPRKHKERTIEVHRISSLDDAVNRLKGLQTLAACYLFAGLQQANYLSRGIHSHFCTINHIPLGLLVGPVAPAHASLPCALSPRYAPAMFTTPSPQYLPRKESLHSFTGQRDQALVQNLVDKALEPLPPVVRRSGHQLNFFGQAILVGFGMVVTSVVGVSLGGVWLLLGQPRIRLFH